MKSIFRLIFCTALFCSNGLQAQNIPSGISVIPGTSTIDLSPADFSGVTLFNYTRTWTPQISVKNSTTLDESCPNEQIQMSTTYTNGFGKAIQRVDKKSQGSGYDLIYPIDNRPSATTLTYLPYPYNSGNGKFRSSAFSEQKGYYLGVYPNEDATAYSKKKYDNWITKQYAPGKATVGQDRGTEMHTEVMSGSFPMYGLDMTTYLPVLLGNYSANQLTTMETSDADGGLFREVKDKDGKLIAKIALQDVSAGNYLLTFYVYDNFGREVFIITPKAYDISGGTITSTVAESLCYYTKYDEQGRIYEKHIPGETGNEYIVYDQKGRVVLTQSPLLRSKGQWAYCLYDKLDRVTTTGLLTSTASRSYFQDIFDGVTSILLTSPAPGVKPTGLLYYLFEQYEGVYPDVLDDCYMLTFNYYDTYSYAASLGRSAASGAPTAYLSPSSFDIVGYVRGKLTATRTRILKPTGSTLNDWITELHFYDGDGNLVHTQRQNYYGAWDSEYAKYDFSGKLTMKVLDHNNPSCTTKTHTVVATRYSYYDFTSKLHTVEQEIDNGGWMQISTNTYNILGQVSNKNIGGIEDQSMSYDIRGNLTGINKSYAEEDGYTHSSSHFFGESLCYETGFTDKFYCGKISGIIWKNSGSSMPMSYGYGYDKAGRLLKADFRIVEPDWSTGSLLYWWNKTKTDYSVSNLTYDDNGNILTIKQMGVPVGATSPTVIDDLTYTYATGGYSNQISSVYDAVSAGLNKTYKLNDYINNSSILNEFSYDESGNLSKHLDKDIVNIQNNLFDLPEKIEFSLGQTIQFIYDANGKKLVQLINDGSTIDKYEYLGPFVYKNNALQFAIHEEGTARYHEKSPSVWGWDYDFFIRDHLGNVRATVTAEPRSWLDYEATYEPATAVLEASFFGALDPLRDPKPGSTSPSDMMAARLTASDPNRRAGSSIMMKVMAGDQFELSAENYYETPYNSFGDPTIPGESLFSSIVSSLAGSGGVISGSEGSDGTGLLGQLFSPENYLGAYQPIMDANTDLSRPKAFINYMIFDENMKLVGEESGIIQANTVSGNWSIIGTSGPVTIHTNGYLVAYLSSASTVSVSFDHFKLRMLKGKLVEETHYYPFGLAINAGTMNPMEKKYLYQSKELQQELGLMWQDFGARQYDPQLGRFNSIDPKGQFSSGYVGMGNNPVSGVDPDGEWAQIVIGAIIGGVVNVAVHWDRIRNWQDAGAAFGIGAAAGAIAGATGGASLLATETASATVASLATSAAATASFSYMSSQPILEIGNNLYFHDPISKGEDFFKGMAMSAGTGFVLAGVSAKLAGLPWFKPVPEPIKLANPTYFATRPNATAEQEIDDLQNYFKDNNVTLKEVTVKSPEKLGLTTSSTSVAPSRTYTIYDGSGDLYKFGVTDANLSRYNQSLKEAGPGAWGSFSPVVPKNEAHILEKYLRSLQYNSTGQYSLPGMKIPYPVNFKTGLPIRP